MKLYHYTIADRLLKILMSGHLHKTPREDSPYLHEGEQRVVWLTTSGKWDKTAFYGYPMEVLENQGMVRITVDSENIPCRVASVHSHRLGDWESLVWSANKVGVDYRDWIICESEVLLKHFKKIELWRDEQWQVIPLKLMLGES